MASLLQKSAENKINPIFDRLVQVKNIIKDVGNKHNEDLISCNKIYEEISNYFQKLISKNIKSYKASEFDSHLSQIDLQLDKLSILPYSEIAWYRLNDLLMKVENYLFYFDIYREVKSVKSRLEDIDKIFESKQSIANINKNITRYQTVIEELNSLLQKYKDERKRNLFTSSLKVVTFSIFVILSIYAINMEIPALYSIIGFIVIFVLMCIIVWGSIFALIKTFYRNVRQKKTLAIFSAIIIILGIVMVIGTNNLAYKDIDKNFTCSKNIITVINISEMNLSELENFSDESGTLMIYGGKEYIQIPYPKNLSKFRIYQIMSIVLLLMIILFTLIRFFLSNSREYIAYPTLRKIRRLLINPTGTFS